VLDGKCIMAPALNSSDYPDADIYGVSEVGILKLGKLKDIMDISV
jgi:hypothetical protein